MTEMMVGWEQRRREVGRVWLGMRPCTNSHNRIGGTHSIKVRLPQSLFNTMDVNYNTEGASEYIEYHVEA